MQFFASAINTLQTLVVALGAGVPTTPAQRARA